MDNQQKHNISLVLLCVTSSVLASILTVIVLHSNLLRYPQSQPQQPPSISQSNTQIGTDGEKTSNLININTATLVELKSLPGIGDILAQRIIDNRPYRDKWEIADIYGIGGERLKNIIDRIEVE